MYDAIFLTTPSTLFADVDKAHCCARNLLAKLKYYCDKNGISDTTVEIGVSNVNPRKAQYIYQNHGVGRPQKILAGNLENCFVKPHLHMVIQGKNAAKISNLIIAYFTKRYKSLRNKNHGVRIWKEYIFNNEVDNVRKYIWIQSLHYLTLKTKKSESNKETKKKVNKKIINVRIKKTSCINKFEVSQDSYNQNYVALINLRNQWLLIQQLKNIAQYIVNFELYDRLVLIQNKIKKYGDMINANINVASLCSIDITNITIELENLRQYTVAEKNKFDYFVGQA